eukprot:m.744574 g.744574  ORF g.744574 m.744574 type:complete len:419 (-) comp58952_c0_seq5:6820-8076(-)
MWHTEAAARVDARAAADRSAHYATLSRQQAEARVRNRRDRTQSADTALWSAESPVRAPAPSGEHQSQPADCAHCRTASAPTEKAVATLHKLLQEMLAIVERSFSPQNELTPLLSDCIRITKVIRFQSDGTVRESDALTAAILQENRRLQQSLHAVELQRSRHAASLNELQTVRSELARAQQQIHGLQQESQTHAARSALLLAQLQPLHRQHQATADVITTTLRHVSQHDHAVELRTSEWQQLLEANSSAHAAEQEAVAQQQTNLIGELRAAVAALNTHIAALQQRLAVSEAQNSDMRKANASLEARVLLAQAEIQEAERSRSDRSDQSPAHSMLHSPGNSRSQTTQARTTPARAQPAEDKPTLSRAPTRSPPTPTRSPQAVDRVSYALLPEYTRRTLSQLDSEIEFLQRSLRESGSGT